MRMGGESLDELGDMIGRIVFLAAIPLGAIGNLLIIIYFLKINFGKWKKMSIYNFLIIQLAVIDMVTSVTTALVINEFYETAWRIGEFSCTFGYPFMVSVMPYLSCWVLVLISYERYRSITQPFAIRGTKCKYSVFISVILVLCCLSYIPFMIKTKVVDDGQSIKCEDGMKYFSDIEFLVYALFLRTFDCFLPAVLLCFFYRRIRNWMSKESNQFPLTEESKRRNSIALKVLRNLIIVYIGSVFPGRLVVTGLHIEDNFAIDQRKYYFNFVHELFSFISLLNNLVNVFVYAFMIKDFRRFLLTLITFGQM